MAEYLDCEISLDTRTIKTGSSVYTVQLNDNVDGIRFLLPVGISEYITLENPVVTLLYLAPGTSQGRTLTLSLGENDGTFYFIYWTFETEFTQYSGVGTFSICIESFENAGDTSATGHWNSQPAKITVYPTMDHDDLVPSGDTEVTPAYIVAIENAVSAYMDDNPIEGSGLTSEQLAALRTLLEAGIYDDSLITAAQVATLIDTVCGDDEEEETDNITLSASSGTITEGGTATVTATVSGSGTLAATSSDTSVATVAVSGTTITITAVAEGSATITATYGDASATYTATVTAEESETVAVTGVTLDASSGTLTVGDTVTLTATVTPSNATDTSVTWSSSDTSVATVSSGVVTAVAAGTATITVTTTDGGYTATYAATVEAAASSSITMNEFVRVSNGGYTALYSDGGETSYSDARFPNSGYLATSDNVFDSDTTVNITFTPTANSFLCWLFGSTDYDVATDGAPSASGDVVITYVTPSSDTFAYGWSTASHTFTVTVKAGKRLAIFANGSAVHEVSYFTVEVA